MSSRTLSLAVTSLHYRQAALVSRKNRSRDAHSEGFSSRGSLHRNSDPRISL